MNKAERHEAIRERAREALRDMYHNATPRYPRDVPEHLVNEFDSWFEFAVSAGIEYIQDGGAYGKDYRKTLEAPGNAGRYKSQKAQQYYVRKGMRDMQLERTKYAQWERVSDYGKLYQWGRGGRTLAPDKLISQRGGSRFAIRGDYVDELPMDYVVDLILVIESFNRHVSGWCKSVPEQWEEYLADNPGLLVENEECAA